MNEREEYRQKMAAQLQKWKAELETMKTTVKADMRVEMAQLEKDVAEGERKLRELSASSGEAWTSIKKGLDDSWTRLGQAFQEAGEKLRN